MSNEFKHYDEYDSSIEVSIPAPSLRAHELVFGRPFGNEKKGLYQTNTFRSPKQVKGAEEKIMELAERIKETGGISVEEE